LKEGDTLYFFTDGYADQFNPADKKLMTKRFKELLLTIQELSMQQQEKHLKDFILNWKKDTEQTDDILVMGISI
jgi:serine phosphatase RsbU (regulator of sigma subunit)